LTQFAPFELVDSVLAETRATQKRLRDLPARVAVYFVLAMVLFPGVGYAGVWEKMTGSLEGLDVPRVCEKALRQARRRLGARPLEALFTVLAVPLAQAHTKGARYRGMLTVAFDGCKSIKAADTEANRGWLKKLTSRLGTTGYPAVMLMSLVETGTRGILAAAFGSCMGTGNGEVSYATRLLDAIKPGMLVLGDRGFDADKLLAGIAGRGAQFLIRLKSTRRPQVLEYLDDGSFRSVIAGVQVRVICAEVTVTLADGTTFTEAYMLVTTLLDHRIHPASVLINLYHERWVRREVALCE
jgi:hypothetical protein